MHSITASPLRTSQILAQRAASWRINVQAVRNTPQVMPVRTEEAKWAVRLLMRRRPPGSLHDSVPGIDVAELVADDLIGAFSRDISRGDGHDRRAAVEALEWLRDRRAISPLLRALRDQDWHVRRAAARALHTFSPLPEWATPRLTEAISDPLPGIRAIAIRILGRSRHSATANALVNALNDNNAHVREEAALALAARGNPTDVNPAGIETLTNLLWHDPDPRVANAAYRAICAQLGEAAAPIRTQYLWSERERNVEDRLLAGYRRATSTSERRAN